MIDWDAFSRAVRAEVTDRPATERALGISHARLHAALHGEPVGTDLYLTLCKFAKVSPLAFWTPF